MEPKLTFTFGPVKAERSEPAPMQVSKADTDRCLEFRSSDPQSLPTAKHKVPEHSPECRARRSHLARPDSNAILGKPEIMPILPTIAAKSFKTAGNQSMCRIGDLSHHPVLLFERPRSQFIYDLDPLQAQRRG
jgi:hypothetical protein